MKTYLDQSDVDKLLAATTNLHDYLIVSILWVTGMRITELISLRVKDFDPSDNTLTIRHLKAKGEEKYRTIPLRPDVGIILSDYIERSELADEDDLVFPICRQYANVMFRNIAIKAGMGGKVLVHPESNKRHYISPHRFRDALAVHWLGKNSKLEGQKGLQLMLGHQRFDTTARYFKLGMKEVKAVYDKIWR